MTNRWYSSRNTSRSWKTGSPTSLSSVTYDEEEDEYVVEGPRIEKMLGYTNLDSEKGFTFFQNF